MVIHKRTLIWAAAVTVALFVAAFPLGDSTHGLGKHHSFLAGLGQTLFVASLCGAVLFVLLAVTAAIQHARARRVNA